MHLLVFHSPVAMFTDTQHYCQCTCYSETDVTNDSNVYSTHIKQASLLAAHALCQSPASFYPSSDKCPRSVCRSMFKHKCNVDVSVPSSLTNLHWLQTTGESNYTLLMLLLLLLLLPESVADSAQLLSSGGTRTLGQLHEMSQRKIAAG
jgi:hypothetical protein